MHRRPVIRTDASSTMHDIRKIRDNPSEFDQSLARRGIEPIAAELLGIDAEMRKKIHESETAAAERNAVSRRIGEAKAKGEKDEFERLRSLVSQRRDDAQKSEREASTARRTLTETLMAIPNAPDADVPDGGDESDNVEIRREGKPREFDFKPLEHFEIPGVASGMDFKTAAKLSGSRFVLMSGAVARIHRALAQFMIDTHVNKNGLTEVWTPALVREEMMFGAGQLPKFGEDSFKTTDGRWLIPTSEVTLTNIVCDMIVDRDYLPRRYCAHTQCFRSEAGSTGKDTAGMLRQHQFEKVEMVSITEPGESGSEHERMTRCAEAILEELGLPYRTVVLCAGDMGFSSAKTYDIEVWLPGQSKHREISSVSNCRDFQARRMNARFRTGPDGPTSFLHTLNGSGLAVGRTLIAVLENGQRADGGVELPRALRPYLGGNGLLSPEGELVESTEGSGLRSERSNN